MALAAWWHGDDLPQLHTLTNFRVETVQEPSLIARINRLNPTEAQQRLAHGHQIYVAFMGKSPVAYGWAATQQAAIGELNLAFDLPSGDSYLWDFATLPDWQGRGIYPHLLQAILKQADAARFWIIYAPENLPSGAGIYKAGFERVAKLSFQADGNAALLLENERGAVAAHFMGLPLVNGSLAPCWKCSMEGKTCTCTAETCTCMIERKPSVAA